MNMPSTEETDTPPLSGRVYGETVFWCILFGMIIACAGFIWQLKGESSVIEPDTLISQLWQGASPSHIWEASCIGKKPEGHWYINRPHTPDGLAMLGIAVCCFSAAVGMWCAFAALVFSRSEKKRPMYLLYCILSAIIALILTLNAAGVF
jgi:hypothetical protein